MQMMIDAGIIDGTIFATIVLGGMMVCGAIMFTLWPILHIVLSRKYDPLLFKAPLFNEAELIMYASWPLSLFKTSGYILLVAAPNFFITKKRFKGVEIDRSNIIFLTLFCWLHLLNGALGCLVMLLLFSWGIEMYLFH